MKRMGVSGSAGVPGARVEDGELMEGRRSSGRAEDADAG